MHRRLKPHEIKELFDASPMVRLNVMHYNELKHREFGLNPTTEVSCERLFEAIGVDLAQLLPLLDPEGKHVKPVTKIDDLPGFYHVGADALYTALAKIIGKPILVCLTTPYTSLYDPLFRAHPDGRIEAA